MMRYQKEARLEDVERLTHQVQRLRNMLAEAWRCRWPDAAVQRIEVQLARRWYRLARLRQP